MELKQQDLLKLHYGNRFEDKLIEAIIQDGIYKSVNQGDVLMNFGLRVSSMPLLLNGAVKILRRDEKENAIVLGESSNDSHCERLRKENNKSDSAPAYAGFITCML